MINNKIFNKFSDLALLKKSLLAVTVRGIGAFSMLLMNYIIANQLSIKVAGDFFFIFAIVMLISQASLLGLQQASIRYISSFLANGLWGAINSFVIDSRLLVLFITSCLASVLFTLPTEIFFNADSFSPVICYISMSIIAQSLSILTSFQLQALGRAYSSIIILSILVPLLFSFFLYFFEINSLIDTMKFYFYSCLLNMFFSFVLWRKFRTINGKDTYDRKKVLNTSLSLWSIVIITLLTQWGAQLVVGMIQDSDSVAIFSVAQRVANVISFVLIAINFIVIPKISPLYESGDFSKLKELIFNSTRILFFISAVFLLLVILNANYILSLFGDRYTEGVWVLIILSVGQFVNAITGFSGYLLTMTGHDKYLKYIVIFIGTLSVPLVFLATMHFGIVGAAFVTAMSVGSQNLLSVWAVRKYLGFNTLSFLSWK